VQSGRIQRKKEEHEEEKHSKGERRRHEESRSQIHVKIEDFLSERSLDRPQIDRLPSIFATP
jgi:hypothetical protein